MEILEILVTANFWAAAVRIASPLIFGVLGALICERAGVLNLGIEGIFTAGAMAGWMAVWLGAGRRGGVLVAALAGGFFGLIHSILTVPLSLSQHVSGLGVTLFATSVSYFTYRTALPNVSSPPQIEPFRALDLTMLSDLPFLRPALFQQTALTWLALLMVVLVWYVLNRTALGLPSVRWATTPTASMRRGSRSTGCASARWAGSSLMALGGSFLTMSAFDAFFFGMANGRGWIYIALVIFASCTPARRCAVRCCSARTTRRRCDCRPISARWCRGRCSLWPPTTCRLSPSSSPPARPTIPAPC